MIKLKIMAYMKYSEQLLHPFWQRKRLEILQRDEFTCSICFSTEKTLHVHHKKYIKGRMVWEYNDYDLSTLCADCHQVEELTKQQKKRIYDHYESNGCKIDLECRVCGDSNIMSIFPYHYKCVCCSHGYGYLSPKERILLENEKI